LSSARPDPGVDVEVRPARPGEHERVGELTVRAYVADAILPEGAAYLRELARAGHRAEHTDLLVAVDPGTGHVLGTVSFVLAGSAYAELARAGEAEFRMLAVDPAARGRGVAAVLVRACLDRARAAGASRVVICSSTRMHAAHRLYERLGFTRLPALDWSPSEGVQLLGYTHDLRPAPPSPPHPAPTRKP
jgi:GNAT superfamily N-acetyltransferase